MSDPQLHVVTGAFGYSGKYIAARLLAAGHRVRTLTGSPNRPDPFGGRVECVPFNFDRPDRLADSLRGAAALYNTYWVRFNHRDFTHRAAVANTMALFDAARRAEVGRLVHVSITNPSEDSPLEYFAGKARLERALKETCLSHAILRPAVLFGQEDILVNNIAWMLRHLPIFGLFGDGKYRMQPIHVDDLAALAVEMGTRSSQRSRAENVTIDAVGPETFAYRDLVRQIGMIIGRVRPIVGVPRPIGYATAWLIGKFVGDVVITWDEIKGLMAGLLCTNSPPAGSTRLTDWAKANAATLGLRYASELARRRDRAAPYFTEAGGGPD
jgi:NADH dehydrogenase